MQNKKKNPALEKAKKLERQENSFENGALINAVNGVYLDAKIDEVLRTDKSGDGSKNNGNGSVKVDHCEDLELSSFT